ncbi:hypothetical protein LUZ61_013500 [Rhynchospora tenuis]|uniref:ATP-dependent DNA helicase n=1 Tax=Rhynchospora tenuis TaxID=198213 RepID=A0AAD5Z2Q0_9POAL|nr:hypothetical protein LUZ61_013500 [Rhynchospora tenuis]
MQSDSSSSSSPRHPSRSRRRLIFDDDVAASSSSFPTQPSTDFAGCSSWTHTFFLPFRNITVCLFFKGAAPSSHAAPPYSPPFSVDSESSCASTVSTPQTPPAVPVYSPDDRLSYLDFGDPDEICTHCHARFWFEERCLATSRVGNPTYSLCCWHGRVDLDKIDPMPHTLATLLDPNNGPDSKHFIENIRMYNSMFAFTSMGVQVDESVNAGPGPYVFKVSGQLCHLLGSLLPDGDDPPRFAQLYMYDTEHEISNRMAPFPSTDQSSAPRPHIVRALKEMLDEYNPYAQAYRSVRERVLADSTDLLRLQIRADRARGDSRYSAPTASEVAGLIVGDLDSQHFVRDIIVERRSGELQRVSSIHPSYMPFQYPLIFTRGEDGFTTNIEYNPEAESAQKLQRQHVTMAEFYCYRLHMRVDGSPIISKSGRLLQQISIDMFACVDQARLWYLHENQASLRSDTYANVRNAVVNDDMFGSGLGKRIILPSSHVGSPRYMYQNYQDAIAVCRHLGPPHLFITFTCNPAWPEITRNLLPGQRASDRPDLVSRVFKMKLNEMIRDFKDSEFFGPISGLIYSVEFQKRGLPHVHIIIWLRDRAGLSDPVSIDRFISAELPNPVFDPEGYSVVSKFMVHGPCGTARPNSPCMQDGKCTKRFPKPFRESTVLSDDGFVLYKRRDTNTTVLKNGVCLDNKYVVPYNLNLLLKYQAHINVERCHRTDLIKYLFKYICKGRDRAMVSVFRGSGRGQSSEQNQGSQETVVDEILDYLDCRYLAAPEAVWRLFQYSIHYSHPTVERLPIHLPFENNVVFRDSQPLSEIANNPSSRRTKLTAWFELNAADPAARLLTYPEVTRHYTWHEKEKVWKFRLSGYRLARIHFVQPTAGDVYYERMMLNSVRGATSFDDLRTVNGVTYQTYKEACNAVGLLDDNSEWLYTMQEAAASASCEQLRTMFVDILLYSDVADAKELWESCWNYMGDDIVQTMRSAHCNDELTINSDSLKDYILHKLGDILFLRGYSLQYVNLPTPVLSRPMGFANRLLTEQYSYNTSVQSREGQLFFVYGHGGTGKTFVWQAITAVLRSEGRIVLTVASSGLSSLLLQGGVTGYSRFKIPLKLREGSTCERKKNTNLAQLLRETSLIIWDEAPMSNRLCFEALDRSMRDILGDINPANRDKPFGGVTVVLGGDFRQTLPVIPHGTRFDTVAASIANSYLWSSCRLLKLTINMRLLAHNGELSDRIAIAQFADWLLSVGDGSAPAIPLYNSPLADWIKIPDHLLINNSHDKEEAIIHAVYADLQTNFHNHDYLRVRAIVTPKNDAANSLNEAILKHIPGEQFEYLSHDSIQGAENISEDLHTMYPIDILNTITAGSLPCHKLSLKIGVPVMLLRNMDQSKGLCNGTRMVITQLGVRVLQAKIITGSGAGTTVRIPRIVFLHEDERLPFIFRRKQFPIRVCYAMTINKSQGQSLDVVGVYLPEPVFAHGQLYVALSRATTPSSVKILIVNPDDKNPNYTRNIEIMDLPIPVTTLTQLTNTDNAVVHGRPVRIWAATDARSGRVWNMVFVFIDHTGAAIQGTIPLADYQRISNIFSEDNICKIARFTVEKTPKDYQAIQHNYMLSLTTQTMVTVLAADKYHIPRNYFEFRPLSDVGVTVTHMKAVMDVIARVVGFGDEVHRNVGGQPARVLGMYLRDNGGRTTEVALWGNFIDFFDIADLFERSKQGPIIIACNSLQIKHWKGIYGLKTYSGTRFFLDPSMKEISDYLAMTPYDGTPITLHATSETFNIHYATSPALQRAEPAKVTIAQLNGLYLDNYNFGCLHNTRYRIRVQVVDHTMNAQFVLLGRFGEQVVGMSALQLRALQEDTSGNIADPLRAIVGKKYLFTVAGKQRSRNQENRIYTVVNVEEVPDDMLSLLPQPILYLEASNIATGSSLVPRTSEMLTATKASTETPPPVQATLANNLTFAPSKASENTSDDAPKDIRGKRPLEVEQGPPGFPEKSARKKLDFDQPSPNAVQSDATATPAPDGE